MPNPNTESQAKENAGAAATASGVLDLKNGSYRGGDDSKKAITSAMKKGAAPAHKIAARCLGFALTAGGFDNWMKFAQILTLRLSREERAALAYAALASLDEGTAYITASTVLFGTDCGEGRA